MHLCMTSRVWTIRSPSMIVLPSLPIILAISTSAQSRANSPAVLHGLDGLLYNHLVTSTTCSLSLSLPRCSSVVASRLDISGCDHTRVPWSFHGLMRMIIVFVIVLLLGCSSTSTINLELLIVSRSHSSYNSYIVLLNFRSTSAKLPPILLVS